MTSKPDNSDNIKFYKRYSKDLDWYLGECKVKDVNEMPFELKAKIFISAISDFFDQTMSVYDLAFVGSCFWDTLTDDQKSSKVGWAMHYAEEIEYYLHLPSLESNHEDPLRSSLNIIESLLKEYKKDNSLGLEKDPKDVT